MTKTIEKQLNQQTLGRRRFLNSSSASLLSVSLTLVGKRESKAQEPTAEALRRQTSVQNPPPCYTDDWQRTGPDYAVYLPKEPGQRDEYADHIHVFFTPGGDLMCLWTQGTYESAPDMRVVYSRSKDGGKNWTPIQVIDESKQKNMTSALGFPLISRTGRMYCLYNQHLGHGDGGLFCGPLRVKYSDDDGHTWITGGVDIPWRRTRFDHPDPKVSPTCVVWQPPIRDAKNRLIAGVTRWSSPMVYPQAIGGNRNHSDSQCELMRFDNIDEGPHPRDLKITWLPDKEGTIRVSPEIEPEASRGYSLAQEPSIVLLPDGRLFMTMRTVTGYIWYTVSDDHGHSWHPTEPLRYQDHGALVEHPKSPEPMYRLADGRYLLFFHNHQGYRDGATGPWDMDARRPIYFTVGQFRPNAKQPIWFSKPKFLFDTHKVTAGVVRLWWLAMYASLTERDGQRTFWYADRKQFVLGKKITDSMLADRTVPG